MKVIRIVTYEGPSAEVIAQIANSLPDGPRRIGPGGSIQLNVVTFKQPDPGFLYLVKSVQEEDTTMQEG